MNLEKFNFEKFQKTIHETSDYVLILRSEEERTIFRKYLDMNNVPYSGVFQCHTLWGCGAFYDKGLKQVDLCATGDYARLHIEDFIDFISSENDLVNFLKETSYEKSSLK